MEVLPDIINWGSPLGIGLFLFFLGTGAGVFFWGISHLSTNNNKD